MHCPKVVRCALFFCVVKQSCMHACVLRQWCKRMWWLWRDRRACCGWYRRCLYLHGTEVVASPDYQESACELFAK